MSQPENEIREIIEEHYPLESACGEAGDAGCRCDEELEEYTWKGYCKHLASKIEAALASRAPATTPTPGEDAWVSELYLCHWNRDKVRTVLRAYRANLLAQAAAPGGMCKEGDHYHENGRCTACGAAQDKPTP